MENLKEAQREMNAGHRSGTTGIVVSGFMWLMASLVAFLFSPEYAVWTLFFGGMLIYPISTLINKWNGATPERNNPLNSLAMEGTFFMLMCIPLALVLSIERTEWFFHGMLMVIGGRYFTFNTLYGNRTFWILGAALGIAGFLLFSIGAQAFPSALTGGVIEIVFGVFIYSRFTKQIPGGQ